MKINVLIFVLFIVINNANSQTITEIKLSNLDDKITCDSLTTESWFGEDKGQHFVGSFIGTILLSQVNNIYLNIDKADSRKIGIGITFSIGITKEIFDSKKSKNYFSWKDMAANVAGILAGLAIMEIN